MFDRFTDRSRKVMSFSRQNAERLNHDYIGTEHMLLGLVEEGSGVAANVLENLDIDLVKVRLEVEHLVKPGTDVLTMGQLPFTPRAKKVLEFAIDEAREMEHNYVGTEHLLLGLLREQDGLAAQVLMNLGLKLEDVRNEVMEFLGSPTKRRVPADAVKARQPYRFSDSALRALVQARDQAVTRGHGEITPEHLRAAMCSSPSGLRAWQAIQADVDKTLGADPRVQPPVGYPPGSSALWKVIESAVDEARTLEHREVTAEHFVLGMLRTGGTTGQVLKVHGLEIEQTRERVKDLRARLQFAQEEILRILRAKGL